MEFLPVPFQRWGLQKAMYVWQRWSDTYVSFALTLFVYLLSRQLLYAALTAILFSLLAWAFRARDKKAEPIMLAIAAVTLSTMHQSSLGSFFLSAIAGGTSLIILIEMWIAKGWKRPLRIDQLAAMGKITFWSLLGYLVFRLGDMAARGQFANAFFGSMGALFTFEIVSGGLVPW